MKPCHSEPAGAGEEPAVLSPAQLQSISTYIDILLRWNARINLTAIRDPDEIVTRHFGESLFAASHLFPRVETAAPGSRDTDSPVRASFAPVSCGATAPDGHRGRAALQGRVAGSEMGGALAPATRLADLGSGAGFPGLPIKLWAPHIVLTLIESNHKKVAFLREVARAITLTDINILHTRAEHLGPDLLHSFDVVTLRAIERFATVLPVAASLLAPGGRLALLIAISQLDEARTTLPTFSWSDPLPVPLSKARILVVGQSLAVK
jgi:16S rRNA (guanine527-N7)-methyltransferase